MPRPLDLSIEGYEKYIGARNVSQLVSNIIGDVRIRGAVDAPIASGTDRFPVVVFSHGLGGQRTWYSNYCGELASRGHLVFSIEHRDGSAPATQVIRADETVRNITYRSVEELE